MWIEIRDECIAMLADNVTPLAGVWIEITIVLTREHCHQSPPSRGCGSKLFHTWPHIKTNAVTPLAGVWIEIPQNHDLHSHG